MVPSHHTPCMLPCESPSRSGRNLVHPPRRLDNPSGRPPTVSRNVAECRGLSGEWLGSLLREVRMSEGKSAREIAKAVDGLSTSYVGMIERGERLPPSRSWLR